MFTNHILDQVEQTLFRVHAYFFMRDSQYFNDIVISNRANVDSAVTASEMLVRLNGDVRKVDFERFLSILYPMYVGLLILTWRSLKLCSASSGRTPSRL
jgi:ABC-type transport system involved in cytochrome bd biosynthesis fused ATPase/permease subunit